MIQPKGTSELTKNLQNDLKTGTDTDLVIGNSFQLKTIILKRFSTV